MDGMKKRIRELTNIVKNLGLKCTVEQRNGGHLCFTITDGTKVAKVFASTSTRERRRPKQFRRDVLEYFPNARPPKGKGVRRERRERGPRSGTNAVMPKTSNWLDKRQCNQSLGTLADKWPQPDMSDWPPIPGQKSA